MTPEEQKRANRKTALILLSIVLIFFVGFVARITWLGKY